MAQFVDALSRLFELGRALCLITFPDTLKNSVMGECIEWTLTYLYLTMIELLVPLRG